MEDFERVLETYMPLVITTTLRNMLPVLIKVVGCGEEGQPETPMPESIEKKCRPEGDTMVENEHNA